MSVSIVRLGSPRKTDGVRIGTVRRPPRGIRKEDYGRLNYYDIWLPMLAPSAELLKIGKRASNDEIAWKQFKKKFEVEMGRAEAVSILSLLAALSHQTDFSIGCYCENEGRCHRSILRELLKRNGAQIV
jgi:uncharacterized protein YeaO (DUF488 family)